MEQEEQEGSDLRFSKMSSLQSSGRDTNNHLMGLLLFVQVVFMSWLGPALDLIFSDHIVKGGVGLSSLSQTVKLIISALTVLSPHSIFLS